MIDMIGKQTGEWYFSGVKQQAWPVNISQLIGGW